MSVQIPTKIPIVLPIKAGGPKLRKEMDALIDTGSTYTVISWADALDMGYEPYKAPEVPVETGGGTIRAPLIVLDFVEILGFRRQKVEALVKDVFNVGVDSIVGWSFLKYFVVSVDPKKCLLEIKDP